MSHRALRLNCWQLSHKPNKINTIQEYMQIERRFVDFIFVEK
jgi:hypothetical protein